MSNKYKINGRLETPLIKEMRNKYEEMFIFGELDTMCEKFGVNDSLLRRLLYSEKKNAQSLLNFDTIIRISHMFDIPYEELINYNAYIEHDRTVGNKKIEEEEKMLKQYSVGKKWEEEILEYYNKKGYFTYKIPTMNNGTVFDIIVVKNGGALMIECKHTDNERLYYAGSGIVKKRDELDHFVNTTGNNVYIYVKSEKTGTWWTTWVRAKEIFEKKGYIEKEDCFSCNLDNYPNIGEE